MENHNEPHHLHFVNLEFQSHQRLISNNCLPQKTKVTYFKQDLHSPLKLIIFAVGKVCRCFPFFHA